MKPPKLEFLWSLGRTGHVGFMRSDMNRIFHTIVAAGEGQMFSMAGHYPCGICKKHGVTEKLAADFLEASFRRAPRSS